MKKYILLIFISTFLVFQSIAQTISKEEITYIDTLITSRDNPAYKSVIDNYFLSKCFLDESIYQDKTEIIKHLELLKTNDSIRNIFYGMINYYYSGNKSDIIRFLDLRYQKDKISYEFFKSKTYIDIYNKIINSNFDYNKFIASISYKINPDTSLYSNIDTIARYKTGKEDYINFIKANTFTPNQNELIFYDISRYYISFIIESSGFISNVTVSSYNTQTKNVSAIFKLMPNWIPAYIKGHPVRSRYVQVLELYTKKTN